MTKFIFIGKLRSLVCKFSPAKIFFRWPIYLNLILRRLEYIAYHLNISETKPPQKFLEQTSDS